MFTSDEDVALYKDAYSPLWSEEDEKVASAAVAPISAEQVQEIVRIANEYRVPLYPISTGRNLGYGGAAPALSGSVVIDLKRMNKILEVDERNAYALVEPGVSYFDLYRHIQERKLKLWIDCPDPGWGSVIGNALDHGVGYTMNPYRDHWDGHCGLEVVTGGGELVRTGMGALPGSKTWQHFKYGFGPHIDGMFSQSNFGVVTKMGVWLMPEPEAYIEGQALVFKHDDIIPLVEHMKYLMNTGLQNCGTNLQSPIRFAVGADPELRHAAHEQRLGVDRAPERVRGRAQNPVLLELVQVLRARGGRARAVGLREEAHERDPGRAVRRRPVLQIPADRRADPHAARRAGLRYPDAVDVLDRRALELRARRLTATSASRPVIPMTGEAVIESQRVFETILQEYAREAGRDVALNVFPQSYHPRTFVILIMFNVMHDVAINRRTREVFSRLVKVAAEHGWGEYRTHTAFMDECADAYSFNDHSLRKLHETIKDAVDPNGVLSAGRYGIWPKHLRKA